MLRILTTLLALAVAPAAAKDSLILSPCQPGGAPVTEAEMALERGDEDEALAWANRANRAASGDVVEHRNDDSCPACGSEVPPEYRFCGSCGEKVR